MFPYPIYLRLKIKKTEPNEDIIRKLCQRLSITTDHSQDEEIGELCRNWYTMLDESSNEHDMEASYREIQDLMDKNYSNHLIMFEIHKIKYFLLIDRRILLPIKLPN